jgi:hypothetical protein
LYWPAQAIPEIAFAANYIIDIKKMDDRRLRVCDLAQELNYKKNNKRRQ